MSFGLIVAGPEICRRPRTAKWKTFAIIENSLFQFRRQFRENPFPARKFNFFWVEQVWIGPKEFSEKKILERLLKSEIFTFSFRTLNSASVQFRFGMSRSSLVGSNVELFEQTIGDLKGSFLVRYSQLTFKAGLERWSALCWRNKRASLAREFFRGNQLHRPVWIEEAVNHSFAGLSIISLPGNRMNTKISC